MQKTIIVNGLDRGGTSAVAGVLRIMGVNMGDNADLFDHEDKEAPKFFQKGGEKLIAQRNARDIWGFKNTNMLDELDMLDRFRNPKVILVIRDPFASACNVHLGLETREDIYKETGIRRERLKKMFEKTIKLDDHLIISYEKLLTSKFENIERIYDFIGYKINDTTIRKCIYWIDPEKGYSVIPRV